MAGLSHLTDEELLRYAHVDFDPLTGTELEAELLKRFEAVAGTQADQQEALDILTEHSVEVDKTKSLEWLRDALSFATEQDSLGGIPAARFLLDVLAEHDIDDPEVLKRLLTRIEKFDALMNDLAEPLANLQTLATTE